MNYEVNGRTLEATETGFLVSTDAWDREVAAAIAARRDSITRTDVWRTAWRMRVLVSASSTRR